MRMVDVTITAILAITIVLIGSYAAQAAMYPTIDTLNDTLRSDLSGKALTTWDMVTGRVINTPLLWGVLTVVGFILWWAMSVQKRDDVTGVYYN